MVAVVVVVAAVGGGEGLTNEKVSYSPKSCDFVDFFFSLSEIQTI
jgi:hypothetical protein